MLAIAAGPLRSKFAWDHLDPPEACRLLEAGPVVPVTTSHPGQPNVMTMGFRMMVQHASNLIGGVVEVGTEALNSPPVDDDTTPRLLR